MLSRQENITPSNRELQAVKTQVVIALYGEKHLTYLKVLVESLHRVGHREIRVVCSDVELDGLDVTVQPFQLDLNDDRKDRIARKLTIWNWGFDKCEDGDDVVFLDADTMVVKPLSPAFNCTFDVAHTTRYDRRWSINTGVVFVRVSQKTRKWFRTWRDMSAWAYESKERRQTAVGQWGHVDQATMLASLEMHKGTGGLEVETLPAQIWNEDRVTQCPDDVAVFHFKGVLNLLLKPYEESDNGDQRLRRDQFEQWRKIYNETT